jgi:hypothetical protein
MKSGTLKLGQLLKCGDTVERLVDLIWLVGHSKHQAKGWFAK